MFLHYIPGLIVCLFTPQGKANMVDVGVKMATNRSAVAVGTICLGKQSIINNAGAHSYFEISIKIIYLFLISYSPIF